MIDALAAIVAGLYLVTVAFRGNARALGELLKRDKGFIPWALGALLVWALWRNPATRKWGGGLMALAVLAFFIQAGGGLFKAYDEIVAKLKG